MWIGLTPFVGVIWLVPSNANDQLVSPPLLVVFGQSLHMGMNSSLCFYRQGSEITSGPRSKLFLWHRPTLNDELGTMVTVSLKTGISPPLANQAQKELNHFLLIITSLSKPSQGLAGLRPATGSLMSFLFIGPCPVMQKLVIPRP